MWTINGVAFGDVQNRILAKPKRGSVELWELQNNSGGWSHPIHIHLVDLQIISRSGGRAVQPYEAVALKDVVLLGPNEKVRVLARYAPWGKPNPPFVLYMKVLTEVRKTVCTCSTVTTSSTKTTT
jgi:bilirubin oxidase